LYKDAIDESNCLQYTILLSITMLFVQLIQQLCTMYMPAIFIKHRHFIDYKYFIPMDQITVHTLL